MPLRTPNLIEVEDFYNGMQYDTLVAKGPGTSLYFEDVCIGEIDDSHFDIEKNGAIVATLDACFELWTIDYDDNSDAVEAFNDLMAGVELVAIRDEDGNFHAAFIEFAKIPFTSLHANDKLYNSHFVDNLVGQPWSKANTVRASDLEKSQQ